MFSRVTLFFEYFSGEFYILYLRILERLDSGKYRIIDWLLIDYG